MSPIALSAGSIAEIVGIKNREEMNGKLAKLIREDETTGRWEVELLDTQERARFRAECLVVQFANGCLVEISGLQSRSDLNGKMGKLCGFDIAAGRWWVEVLETQEQGRFKMDALKGPVQKLAEEEAARKAAEEAERIEMEHKLAEAEAERIGREQKLAEEEAARKAAEEAEKVAREKKEAEEAAARKIAEEAKRKEAETQSKAAAARRAAQEEAQRKAAEACKKAEAKKKADDAEAKKKAAETKKRGASKPAAAKGVAAKRCRGGC